MNAVGSNPDDNKILTEMELLTARWCRKFCPSKRLGCQPNDERERSMRSIKHGDVGAATRAIWDACAGLSIHVPKDHHRHTHKDLVCVRVAAPLMPTK